MSQFTPNKYRLHLHGTDQLHGGPVKRKTQLTEANNKFDYKYDPYLGISLAWAEKNPR